MFNKFPTAVAHKSCVDRGMYVTPEYIISECNGELKTLNKFCPHRRYPLGTTGEHKTQIKCKLHGFEFNPDGSPINNDKSLACSTVHLGKSGILFKDFTEPKHTWVDDLSKEQNLKYSHITTNSSKGSWLWTNDIAIDLFHVSNGLIHPLLMQQVDPAKFILEEGDGWAIQHNGNCGWWLFIYPFTFIEYSNPGCLAILSIIPTDNFIEYGFNWYVQYYYNDEVSRDRRIIFETLELTYSEDVQAAELQRGDYFPLLRMSNPLEKHCVSFGDWVIKNKLKTVDINIRV